MLKFNMITMVWEDADRRWRKVFTVLNRGVVSVAETEILNGTKIGRSTLYNCNPEIIANMIQNKYNEGFRIVDYM